jgi:hypothetical protein
MDNKWRPETITVIIFNTTHTQNVGTKNTGGINEYCT